MSPTARTLKWLRENGYLADVVEKWQTFPGAGGRNIRIRRDLFGFADILAIHTRVDAPAAERVILIQATSGNTGGEHSKRRRKIEANEHAETIRASLNCAIEVWSWAKQGARGKRKVWTLRRERWVPGALGWAEQPT